MPSLYSLHIDPGLSRAVTIEGQLRFQLPGFQILGLANIEIQEARERITATFIHLNIPFPDQRIILNLHPGDIKKSGVRHDVAMAMQILFLGQERPLDQDIFALGHLGLTGNILPVGGMANLIEVLLTRTSHYPFLLFLHPEDTKHFESLMSWRSLKSLSIPTNFKLFSVTSFSQIWDWFSLGIFPETTTPIRNSSQGHDTFTTALLPLKNEEELLVKTTIAGGHHALILGPKGVGKSQLLNWFQALQRPSDHLQTWNRWVYSNDDLHEPRSEKPFRGVHSSIRPTHLLGSWDKNGYAAGELAKAHGGILFADEFPEWNRDSKETLREPIENRKFTLIRKLGSRNIDCDVQFLATGNFCKCGGIPLNYFKEEDEIPKKQRCRCRPIDVEHYLNRLSGPIVDRMDILYFYLSGPKSASFQPQDLFIQKERMDQQIQNAQTFMKEHLGSLANEISVLTLESILSKTPNLKKHLDRFGSLRSRHKLLRIGMTLAAFQERNTLDAEDILSALKLRRELY